jgi:hypothetical protein
MNEHPRVCANDLARRSCAMLILLATSLGMLVAQVDSSVVNLAIKQIGSDLDASVTALQWVIDVYNLLFAALMLTGGRLADRFGRPRIFVIGRTLLALGSVICADPYVGLRGREGAGAGDWHLRQLPWACLRRRPHNRRRYCRCGRLAIDLPARRADLHGGVGADPQRRFGSFLTQAANRHAGGLSRMWRSGAPSQQATFKLWLEHPPNVGRCGAPWSGNVSQKRKRSPAVVARLLRTR